MTELSLYMRQAVAAMQNPEGLVRYPGGFWRDPGSSKTFSTSTVQAVVTRGAAAYTEFKEGRNGRFPIRAELIVDGVAPKLREPKPWTPTAGYFAANPSDSAPQKLEQPA